MKNAKILIELIGELRSENAKLKSDLKETSCDKSYWYERYSELNKEKELKAEPISKN